MATDNGFGALKGVVVEPQSSEQEKKELEELRLQYTENKKKFEKLFKILKDVHNIGDEILDEDVKKKFDENIDLIVEKVDEFRELKFIDERTSNMKAVVKQNDLLWEIKELVEEVAEVADVDILPEAMPDIKESNDKVSKKTTMEKTKIKTKAQQKEEMLSFFKGVKEVEGESDDGVSKNNEDSGLVEDENESNEQTIESLLNKFDETIERAKKDYPKNKRIKNILDQTGRKVKAERGVINIKNKKKRDVEVKKLQAYVIAVIGQLEDEMQRADAFVNLVKEFGRTGKVHNSIDGNIEINKYNVQGEGQVTYTQSGEKHIVGVEDFRVLIADIKNQNRFPKAENDAYNALRKRIEEQYNNKELKDLIKNIDSVAKKKENALNKKENRQSGKRAQKIKEFRNYLVEVTQQITDEVEKINQNKKVGSDTADVDAKKDSQGDDIEQKQKKRSDFFEERYGSDVYYVLYDGKNKDGFPIDDFLIKEYIVGTTPGKDRVIIEHKHQDISLPLKKFQSQWIKKGFVKDDNSSNAKNDIKSEGDVDDAADILELEDELNNDVDDNNLVGVDENLFSADTNDRSNVGDTLQLDDELEDVDENLFGNDASDESVTEDLDATKVQIEGIEDFEESEREIITSVFVFAQKTFEGVDSADEERMLEFAEDIKREFIEEYSVVEKQRLEKMTQIILDNLDIDSSTLLQPSQENDVATKEKDDEKEDGEEAKSELEKNIGSEVFQFALEEIQLFYNDVGDNADWGDMDDMEKEDRLAEMVDEFIEKIVEMIDWESAQNYLTKQEKMELFKKSFFVE